MKLTRTTNHTNIASQGTKKRKKQDYAFETQMYLNKLYFNDKK